MVERHMEFESGRKQKWGSTRWLLLFVRRCFFSRLQGWLEKKHLVIFFKSNPENFQVQVRYWYVCNAHRFADLGSVLDETKFSRPCPALARRTFQPTSQQNELAPRPIQLISPKHAVSLHATPSTTPVLCQKNRDVLKLRFPKETGDFCWKQLLFFFAAVFWSNLLFILL